MGYEMLKYLIVLSASLIGSFYLFLLITFKKQVSGDFIVFNGMSISRWQRCRRVKNFNIISFYNFGAYFRIYNVNNLTFTKVGATTILRN